MTRAKRQEIPGIGVVLNHFPAPVPLHIERMLVSQVCLGTGLGR